MTADLDAFVSARPRLVGLAYRMLGSRAEAEDIVSDIGERWMRADRSDVRQPEAWLVTATTRRALDVLRSARLQRVDYPGEWLPEPIVTDGDPSIDAERRESLTMGFLVLLERLTPLERTVFVLHDILEYPYDLVAGAVDRSQDACRQAVHRARRHVRAPTRQTTAERQQAQEATARFIALGLGGSVEALLTTLAPDVVVTSDGGGIVYASMRPVQGRQRAARYLANLAARAGDDPLVVLCELNGEPGMVLHGESGWVALTAEIVDHHVAVLRMVASPPKLERLVASLGARTAGRPGPWNGPGHFRHRRGRPVPARSVASGTNG